MMVDLYHVCVHCILVAVIVTLLREYWCIYALHQPQGIELLRPQPPVHQADPILLKKHTALNQDDPVSDCDDTHVTNTCSSRHRASNVVASTVTEYQHGSTGVVTDARYMGHEATVTPSPSLSDVVKDLINMGTSAWCTGTNHTDRHCKFHNICYFPQHEAFGFLHSPRSIMYGIPFDRFSPTLLDMSSVRDHNTQYFNYVDLPAPSLGNYGDVKMIRNTVLAFHRFNPDNLMHVFHDDLLPLFSTLRMMNATSAVDNLPFDVQLLFMEGWQPGQYSDLYNQFSAHHPLYKRDLIGSDVVTCFTDVHFGLNKDTTWYQYGFKVGIN